MGIFLNSSVPFEAYRLIRKDTYFIDKTSLIKKLFSSLETEKRFLCITRPRRFGKSVMANMIGAFFNKAVDASAVFDALEIAASDEYRKHLNQHNIIYIDFSEAPRNCTDYRQYIDRIQNSINDDLAQAFPDLEIDIQGSTWDILNKIFQKTHQKFIFVMDEWDAVFHMPFITKDDRMAYLLFLRSLLKGKAYVELAYMTGVLPIAKYFGGSELNMFMEYDMVTKVKFGEYFGFLETEVDRLYDIYLQNTKLPAIERSDLTVWYDGYHIASGEKLYNPQSVICALSDNQISNYWTNSGPYDEIFYYIKNNINDVRDDIALMVSGERIEIKLQGYAALNTELNNKNQIYSAMVVYGLLTYEDGAVSIPNKELMDKYNELLLTNDSLGYIYNLAKESGKMLRATLCGDVKTMCSILKFAHDTESPIFSYNSEIELSAIVNLVYLAARDKYRVEREDKAGEGYVDFIFYPEKKNADAIILELKIDSTPEDAIRQIKCKNYALRFKGKMGEKAKYTGRILAVGISYDRKTKVHSCNVEVI